jgi:two-component system, cell cycle sensor histidine kinase and response regulator CckA
MSVLSLFLLAAVVELGIPEALVIGVTCVVVQCLWHARLRPRPIQVVFSVADVVLAITAAYYAYRVSALPLLYLKTPLRLAIAASVFFVFNTVPIAAVIALTEKKSIRQVWSKCYGWSYAHYLVGAAMVGVFMFANRTLDWQAWLLILPVVYVIYRSYRLYVDKLQTERKRTQEDHQHSEEVASLHAQTVEALASAMLANARLDAVIQASPLATLAVDRDGKVTSWNPTAVRVFGWSAEEAIGNRPPFAAGRSEEFITDVIERTLRGELVTGLEGTQERKDGTSFSAAIWTARLEDRSEGVSGILVMVADVSDRKQLEEQLRLSQKMEAVGRLAGGIAHDFNNLLTVINGYGSMLTDSLKGSPYAHGYAEEIVSAGTRAADLVSQLLTFSRRRMTQPKPIEANQLVRDMERMLQRVITEHIELTTALDPDSGWIHADVNQMEAALLNLATNARDAMPNGGVLSISTARVEVTPMDQRPGGAGLAPGSYVRLAVKDTGQGMDKETQQHLFEPFFTTKQVGKGTGLGLPSVYGGVEQNHGSIVVESVVGQGSTFSIYLPRVERPNLLESRHTLPCSDSKGSETILLVEDESAVRRMMFEALTRTGYRVWEATNGADAIRKFGEQIGEVDLLVTDIMMPVMNGLRLAEELRSRRPSLNVMFTSGHAEDVISGQGRVGTVADLLQKPFLPDVLVQKVHAVLDRTSDQPSQNIG